MGLVVPDRTTWFAVDRELSRIRSESGNATNSARE